MKIHFNFHIFPFQPFQPAPAPAPSPAPIAGPLTPPLAGWMTNAASVAHQTVSAGPLGLTVPSNAGNRD